MDWTTSSPFLRDPAIELLLSRFKEICPEEAKSYFTQILPAIQLERYTLKKPHDLYIIYATALKVAKYCGENHQQTQQCFIQLLEALKGKRLSRIGVSPSELDFTPIIEIIQENKDRIACNLEIVNGDNFLQVDQAAHAIDQLGEEGLGWSFGFDILKSIIQAPTTCCILARCEKGSIVGGLLGTCVTLLKTAVPATVFHIWLCIRKANYPGIHLIDLLKPLSTHLMDRFDPDFCSLNVDLNNSKAQQLYADSGFIEAEKVYNSLARSMSTYMVKQLKQDNDVTPPCHQEVSEAIQEQAMQLLGVSGVFQMIQFKIKRIVKDFLYQ